MNPGFNLLNKYIFQEKIGTGGMGEIWLATKISDNLNVSIKIAKSGIDDKSFKSVLETEANNSSLINHEHICKVIEYISSDDRNFLVMEHLDGLNLTQYLNSFSFENEHDRYKKSLYIIKCMLQTLDYLHSFNKGEVKKIIHRDINPSNIFITKNNKVKLLDFGTSKLVTSNGLSVSESSSVTKKYSCPDLWDEDEYLLEQYEDFHDLYSLGLVFLEVCEVPLERKLAYLDQDQYLFKQVLDKWLHVNKSERYQDAKTLLSDLDYFFLKHQEGCNFFVETLRASSLNVKKTKADLTLIVDPVEQSQYVKINSVSRVQNFYFYSLVVFSLIVFSIMALFHGKYIYLPEGFSHKLSEASIVNASLLIIFSLLYVLVKAFLRIYFFDFNYIAFEYYKLLGILFIQRRFSLISKFKILQKILKKYSFRKKKLNIIKTSLVDLREKCLEKKLKLGMIGEFSSGKTTLINAIIGYDFLKTSPMPTTSITNSVVYSKKNFIEITDLGNNSTKKIWFEKSEDDFEKMIEHFTTSETGENVKIKIGVNSKFLKSGFEILDTPGANSENASHKARALRAIHQDADYVIILIKATQPLSLSLKKLINEVVITGKLNFAFVVTQIDQIPLRERERLLADIKKRLEENLNISNFQFFPISAARELNYILNRDNSIENLEYHHAFESFINSLKLNLVKGREEIIEKRIQNSIFELKLKIQKSLENEILALKIKRASFNEVIIKNIDQFQNSLREKFEAKMKEATQIALSSLEVEIQKDCFELIKKIELEIVGASDKNTLIELSNKLPDRVHAQMIKDSTIYIRNFNEQVNYNLICALVEKDFWENYNKLKKFNHHQEEIDIPIKFKVELTLSNELKKQLESANSDSFAILAGGAVAGAAVGTMLMPGIGTVLGGIIGGVIGALAGPSLAEMKKTYLEKTRPLIKTQFNHFFDLIKFYLLSQNGEASHSFNTRLFKLFYNYTSSVEIINSQIILEKNKLEKTESIIRKDLKEIERVL